MKLIKTIMTTIDAADFMAWTDYQTDDDFIVYAIEKLDINYMSLLLDEKSYTDYSIIYKAHNIFTPQLAVQSVWPWANLQISPDAQA